MGLFRRRGGGKLAAGEEDETPLTQVDDAITEKAQEVMKDNLDAMKEVVMKLRDDEAYARNMYAECPRLQHMLDKNPDLRPVFEDPRLVRINFETVYRNAGGVLPEDEEALAAKKSKQSIVVRIASSPVFKVFKFLLFLKKFIGCIAGGGIAAISGVFHFFTDCCTDCCCEDALEELDVDDNSADNFEDMEIGDLGPLDPNQEALNSAADYMEDPEVQEQIQRLLDDPENLQDAIDNDHELRNLRDTNPLCAELMSDPETMKIMVDPDNLRALGEAPALIEADFADPAGFVPEADFFDIDGDLDVGVGGDLDGGMDIDMDIDMDVDADLEMDMDTEMEMEMDGLDTYSVDYDDNDIQFDMGDDADVDVDADADAEADVEAGDADADADAEGEEGGDEGDEEEEEDEGGWEEDLEFEEQELDADADADAANKGKGKGKGNAKNRGKSQAEEEAKKRGTIAGVMATLGVAATDLIASQIVGQVFGDGILPGDLMGGADLGDGPDLGGIEEVADQTGELVNDDVAGLAEDTVDDVSDQKAEAKAAALAQRSSDAGALINYDAEGRRIPSSTAAAAAAGAGAATAGVGVGVHGKPKKEKGTAVAAIGGNDDDSFASIHSDEDEFEDEGSNGGDDEDDEEEKGGKMSSKFFGAFKDIAAATITGAKEHIAGTLLGDDLGELLVEKQEEMGEESGSEDGDKEDDDGDEKNKKKGDELETFEDEEVEKKSASKRKLFGRK